MSAGAWTAVRVRPSGDRAAVIAALFQVGAEGVQELDDEIVTHLRDTSEARVSSAIHEVDRGARIECRPAVAEDWASAWKAAVRAHRVGALVVTPPWLADQFEPGHRVVIEPAMAFGTGEHETTRGVIRLLSRVVRAGDVVADLGAGSAVLSIAAVKLGAARAIAIEIDPDAIGNAEENVERNELHDRVVVVEGDAATLLPLVAPVRVIVANIISSILLELLGPMSEALTADGTAIVSGLLREERSTFESALRERGWQIMESDEEGLWWSATIVRS